MITDMALQGKRVFFWNWEREPFHAVMRFNIKYFELFKLAETVEDFIVQLKADEALNEIKSDE